MRHRNLVKIHSEAKTLLRLKSDEIGLPFGRRALPRVQRRKICVICVICGRLDSIRVIRAIRVQRRRAISGIRKIRVHLRDLCNLWEDLI